MDALSKQLTMAKAYDVSAYAKSASVDQLFWALDRFHFDLRELDEGAKAQRLEATQVCALELDARGIPLRDPRIEVQFPRPFPGVIGPQAVRPVTGFKAAPATNRQSIAEITRLPEWLTCRDAFTHTQSA